jgi:hypothetical protein
METGALYLAMSGVMGAAHAMKALAARGLMTPEEVEEAWSAIIAPLQGHPELEALVTDLLEEAVANMRVLARDQERKRNDPERP